MHRTITFIPAFFLLLFFGCFVFAQQDQPAVTTPPAENAGNSEQPDAGGPDPGEEKNAVEMSDIHDIKPPEEAATDLSFLIYVFGAVLIVAAVFALLFHLSNRTGKTKEKKFVRLPPDETALNLLDELVEVENIDGKEFYFRLSSILRNYIEGRFEFNAAEMTTEELLPKIDKLGTDRKLLKDLKELMLSTDPVKFAGEFAVESKMKTDLAFVRTFVNQTKQKEEETVSRQPSTGN